MTAPARRIRREHGAAAVEVSLLLPVLMALIATVLFAGWLGFAKTVTWHGARTGAETAAVPVSDDLRTWPEDDVVTAAVEDAMPVLSPSRVLVLTRGEGRNAPVRVEVEVTVANPVAYLFAPLRLVGVSNPVPSTITITSASEVRRE